jgi:hypothetical protein
LLTLQIKCDLRVDAIAGDFAVVHFGAEFLDIGERMFRKVSEASLAAPYAASSQLFGDCDISSITLTTLVMAVVFSFL